MGVSCDSSLNNVLARSGDTCSLVPSVQHRNGLGDEARSRTQSGRDHEDSTHAQVLYSTWQQIILRWSLPG